MQGDVIRSIFGDGEDVLGLTASELGRKVVEPEVFERDLNSICSVRLDLVDGQLGGHRGMERLAADVTTVQEHAVLLFAVAVSASFGTVL